MLGHWRLHADFQAFLARELAARWTSDRPRIEFYADEIESAWLLDLDRAHPVLAPLYPPLGRPSNQAPEVLRSLLLMTLANEPSVTRWHARLVADPILAIACGFEPGCVAGVGSFHYLFDKLWPAETAPVARRPRRRRRSRPKKGEKLPPKHPGIVERLAEQAEKGRRFNHRPEHLLQELLARIAVDISADLDLLGDPEHLDLALDGAPLETGASPYGRRTCTCKTRRCDCPRRFQDRWANWGWDSSHERWFFGHTLYHVTAASSPYDLPIYLRLPQASRNDAVTGFLSLVETIDLYPQFTLRRVLYDSAHDNAPTYTFCYANGIAPYIDANPRRSGQEELPPPRELTEDGRPTCQAGEAMLSDGYDPKRKRRKWRCPRTCNNRGGVCSCSPSAYGRVIYTRPHGDRREPPVSRDSDAWRRIYARRTTVERSLKRALIDHHLEAARCRRRHLWFWRATLCAIAQHIEAWIAHARAQEQEPLAWLKEALPQPVAA